MIVAGTGARISMDNVLFGTAILDEVHRYWFGELSGPAPFPKEKSEIWFRQSDATDSYIRAHFGDAIAPAVAEHWDLHRLTREQQVGLVVLLDQFPRNIFRSSGEAFACDVHARTVADRLLAHGHGRYHLIERMFLYLPFEHGEAMADQIRSMRLYEDLLADAPEDQRQFYKGVLDFAAKHRDLIARFGRFPHRNVMLGRETTPEEAAFLKEHGRGF